MKKLKIKALDLAVVFTFLSIIVFTIVMIVTFYRYYAIPDTLCTCFFGCFGGECGALAWIKTSKIRIQDRQWQNEDYEKYKTENQE